MKGLRESEIVPRALILVFKLTLMPRREEGINKQKTRYRGLGDIKTFKGELGGGS